MITANDVLNYINRYIDQEGLFELPCGDIVQQVPNALPGIYQNLEG